MKLVAYWCVSLVLVSVELFGQEARSQLLLTRLARGQGLMIEHLFMDASGIATASLSFVEKQSLDELSITAANLGDTIAQNAKLIEYRITNPSGATKIVRGSSYADSQVSYQEILDSFWKDKASDPRIKWIYSDIERRLELYKKENRLIELKALADSLVLNKQELKGYCLLPRVGRSFTSKVAFAFDQGGDLLLASQTDSANKLHFVVFNDVHLEVKPLDVVAAKAVFDEQNKKAIKEKMDQIKILDLKEESVRLEKPITGILPKLKDGKLVVDKIILNSSAHKSGIKPGFEILTINGVAVADKSIKAIKDICESSEILKVMFLDLNEKPVEHILRREKIHD